jgi:hypothetical protein
VEEGGARERLGRGRGHSMRGQRMCYRFIPIHASGCSCLMYTRGT